MKKILKCEKDSVKKTYIQQQNSFIHKPAINYKKYKNISPKYNKYINKKTNKNNNNNSKNNLNEKKNDYMKKNKINIDKNKNNSKLFNNSRNNKNDFLYNDQKKKKKSKDRNLLKFLTININNNENNINKDKIYYLNVNETTACDTFINKVIYTGHNSIIEQIILEKIENPVIEKGIKLYK